MRFTVRAFGLEIFSLDASTEDEVAEADDSGVTASTVVGFTASPGDQRWATPGADFGEDE